MAYDLFLGEDLRHVLYDDPTHYLQQSNFNIAGRYKVGLVIKVRADNHKLWLVFLMKCMFSMTPPFLLYLSLSSMPYCFTKPFQSNLLFPTEFILRLRLQIARITWFRYWQAICVFLRSYSSGFYSKAWCQTCSQFCFFSMISSCPVSSLRMNSLPAKTTRLLGFMDSELSILLASQSESSSSLGLTLFMASACSSFISLYSSWMDSSAVLAIFLRSCSWRQSASSCLVGLQSSSSQDQQSWKYFRIIIPLKYANKLISDHLQPEMMALFLAVQCAMNRQKLRGSFVLSMKPSRRKSLRFHSPQGYRISLSHCFWKRQFSPRRYS